MTDDEIRAAIEQLVAEQEDAIRSRDERLWSLFDKCRDAFLSNADGRIATPSADELLIKQFLMSSSFIAAHDSVLGNKANRDKAAQSCALLIASLGHDPMTVLELHIKAENLWITSLRREGLSPKPRGCGLLASLVLILVAAFAAYWIFFSEP